MASPAPANSTNEDPSSDTPASSRTQDSNSKLDGADPESTIGNYRLDRTIGQGTYGKVRLGIHTVTEEKVAVKIIEKSQIQSAKQVARLQREIRFLKLLHHPHIVKVYDVIETNDRIYIIMEYAVGGELFDYIVAHKRVKEKEARSFFRMVLSAVDYCHKNAVIHRDLKPENLLLDEKKNIKIVDFGFGNNFTLNGLLDTFCGSPFYAAPEMILGKKYEGPEVDMWSLGVILFALLCGHLPFDDDNMKELYKKIASGSYKCPDYLLPGSRHLISRLITVDPKQRATLEEVLVHPWVNEGYGSPPPNYIPQRTIISDSSKLSKDIINRLQIFGYKLEEIYKAFNPDQDFSKPHPIRATYYLLSEMVAREQARLRSEKRRLSGANIGSGSSNDVTAAQTAPKAKSASLAQLGQSLPMIDEDGNRINPPLSVSPTKKESQTRSNPNTLDSPDNASESFRNNIVNYSGKDYSSIPVLSSKEAYRRASASDGYARAAPATFKATSMHPHGDQDGNVQKSNMSARSDTNAPTLRSDGPPGSQGTIVPTVGNSDNFSAGSPPSNGAAANNAKGADLPPLPGKISGIGIGLPVEATARRNDTHRAAQSHAASGASVLSKGFFRRQSVPVNLLSGNDDTNSEGHQSTSTYASSQQQYPKSDGGQSPQAQTQSEPKRNYNAKSQSHMQLQSDTASDVTNTQNTNSPKASQSGRRISSTAIKLKEDLRAVSGWFLNVSTTTSKPPEEILAQVVRILDETHATWRAETKFTLQCEVDVNDILTGKTEIESPSTSDPMSSNSATVHNSSNNAYDDAALQQDRAATPSSGARSSVKSRTNLVGFQIEICKVPRMNLHGIHFKRLSGGVWSYKKICNKILSYLVL